jgi:hypothetical protein
MEGSRILAWIALGFAGLAAGTLLHTYIRPEREDRASKLLTRSTTAMVCSMMVVQLPRLFHFESTELRWGSLALGLVLLVYAFAQLRRFRRSQATDSHTSARDRA